MAWLVTDAAKTATFDSTVLHRPRTARRRDLASRRRRILPREQRPQVTPSTGQRRARRGGQSDLPFPPARRTSCTLRHRTGNVGQNGAERGREGREGQRGQAAVQHRAWASLPRVRVRAGCVQGACRVRAGCMLPSEQRRRLRTVAKVRRVVDDTAPRRPRQQPSSHEGRHAHAALPVGVLPPRSG